jgi:hypothetical protein
MSVYDNFLRPFGISAEPASQRFLHSSTAWQEADMDEDKL